MSGIQVVRMYKAEDGSHHDTMEKAYAHNAQYKCLTKLRELMNRAGNVAHISFVNDPKLAKEMRDTMNKVLDYHRRYKGMKKS